MRNAFQSELLVNFSRLVLTDCVGIDILIYLTDNILLVDVGTLPHELLQFLFTRGVVKVTEELLRLFAVNCAVSYVFAKIRLNVFLYDVCALFGKLFDFLVGRLIPQRSQILPRLVFRNGMVVDVVLRCLFRSGF